MNEKDEVIKLLKEIEKWPEPSTSEKVGEPLGPMAGTGMLMQYDADKGKHEKQIRDVIKKIKRL